MYEQLFNYCVFYSISPSVSSPQIEMSSVTASWMKHLVWGSSTLWWYDSLIRITWTNLWHFNMTQRTKNRWEKVWIFVILTVSGDIYLAVGWGILEKTLTIFAICTLISSFFSIITSLLAESQRIWSFGSLLKKNPKLFLHSEISFIFPEKTFEDAFFATSKYDKAINWQHILFLDGALQLQAKTPNCHSGWFLCFFLVLSPPSFDENEESTLCTAEEERYWTKSIEYWKRESSILIYKTFWTIRPIFLKKPVTYGNTLLQREIPIVFELIIFRAVNIVTQITSPNFSAIWDHIRQKQLLYQCLIRHYFSKQPRIPTLIFCILHAAPPSALLRVIKIGRYLSLQIRSYLDALKI